MGVKYPPLQEVCKNAIRNNLCLGCVGLAEEDWIPPKECKYVQDSIEYIKETLGIQERIKL